MARNDVRELVDAVFGDDPKWFAEAERIERLVATGQLEDANIALSHLLFKRHVEQRRNGIDLAIMRAATKLLETQIARRAHEEIDLLLGALEGLAGSGLDHRAVELGTMRMRDIAGALAVLGGDLANRASAIRFVA